MDENSFKISVIVPVYGVELFVGRCVMSLMRQTLDDVEFIFVDDCTPDASMEIVREVVHCFPQRSVKFLRHENNRGLPAARNTGMRVATGKYIFHCDSDDFLEPEMLEKLYAKAVEYDADIAWCDWYLYFGKRDRYMTQPNANRGRDALCNSLSGAMKYNVWNKLVRRALYEKNGICFPDGYSMGEDMTMLRLMACANRTIYVPSALYYYVRTNPVAMTQIYSERHLIELRHNVDETIRFIKSRVADSSIDYELNLFKLNVKLPFLFTGRLRDVKIWREWYPDVDRFIMSNKRQTLRTRLLQMCASWGLTWINVIYTKLIYGKFFK